MAFGRICELDIGVNNNLLIRISNLHFNFEVERSVERENNYSKFTIINAKKETREKVLIKGNNIALRVGYKDENNLGLISYGIIQQSTSRLEGTEYITDIYATDFGSNQTNSKNELISFNYNSGITYATIISDIANTINVPVIGLNNVSTIILNNGFVFYGTIVQLIKQIQKKLLAYNIKLYFDLGEMVIYNTDSTPTRFGVVQITPNSGLIGEVEEIIDEEDNGKKRIAYKSLLNPKLKPSSIVRIVSDKVTGGFVNQKVIHRGNNIGTDEFVSECEAIE